MKAFLSLLVLGLIGFGFNLASAAPPAVSNTALFAGTTTATGAGKIDRLVFARLSELNLPLANVCSDEVFVRRVFLDVIGTLPTAQEAKEFLRSKASDKRRVLIDRLLARDEFADYWAMKWSDLLRVKAEFPINLWPNAAQSYHRWIRTALKENLPYDQFVRKILTASGSNFREAPVNFYRAVPSKDEMGIAQAVALTFMGERFNQWPTNRQADLAGFFASIGFKSTAEWKEEIVFFDPDKTNSPLRNGSVVKAIFPDGKVVWLSADRDPREVFSDWLITPTNPWFTQNIANRVWFWLLGRGIINEPDDIRPDNPPSNPELLALLEKELIGAKYDLKALYRLILNSQTYQLASVPKNNSPVAAANFASYPLRRLDAEVMIDALNQITGTTEKYSSSIPEPFTYIPEDQRSIALPDGSISSAFLEQFGRPSRDTGLESERNNRTTSDQRLHLLNSTHIQKKLERGPGLRKLFQTKGQSHDALNMLYLSILSRFPTENEIRVVRDYQKSDLGKQREMAVDVAWALINSPEFLYRH